VRFSAAASNTCNVDTVVRFFPETDMYYSLPRTVFTFLLASLAAGCASQEKVSKRESAPELSQQRLMLSEGYSMLYKDASNLDLAELILYAKAESEAVDKIVKAAAEVGGQLKKDLERIARDYPGVRINLDPMPEMEKRKRAAITKGRAKYFAPIVGKGGREYERTVLIGYANGINHERHLCKVMAEAEPDAGLKKFLLDTEKRYDGLYDRVTALLEKEYFKDPNGKTSN
jgi:hypothetical protein